MPETYDVMYGDYTSLTIFSVRWLSQNPGLHFYIQGESEFHHGDFGAAIQYFSIALTVLENFPTSPRQLTVKALLRRAQCFFILVRLRPSVAVCQLAIHLK